jgi:hypothetical protein
MKLGDYPQFQSEIVDIFFVSKPSSEVEGFRIEM